MRLAIAFVLLVGVLPCPAAAETTPPADYEVTKRQGFTLLVHREVANQRADRFQRKPLDVLDAELFDLKRAVGAKILPVLQQVPIWVNWDITHPQAPGVVAVYYGATGQLTASEKLRANTIEILSLKRIGELRPPGSVFQQVITLHEMAHAIHHRVLGLDAVEVTSTFQQAMERRLYDDVADRFGRRGKPYARTNANEYFAELSCAFLDTCHYYPFTYSDLAAYDPAGFALMEAVWKKPEQFNGRAPAVNTPKFVVTSKPASSERQTSVRSGPDAERIAFEQLDRARAQHQAGRKDDARKAAETLIRAYPTTMAAADARKWIAQLR